jgi:glucose-1-phosphate thymidylyltransferase
VALILGDNIFFGPGMGQSLKRMKARPGATVFAYQVANPGDFGVVEFDESGNVVSLEEKPKQPKSNFVIPGLYFYDKHVAEIAHQLKPSPRGELEITDLHNMYLDRGLLQVEVLGKDNIWLDTGTIDAMHSAATMVSKIERDLGTKINVPEEVAWRMGYISDADLLAQAKRYLKSGYGEYLQRLFD